MHTLNTPSISVDPRQSVAREDLLALANFFDQPEHAVSFYFSLSPTTDNSHRQEALMIKDLVKAKGDQADARDGVAQDLAAIARVAEEIRHAPARLRAVFACRDQHIWQVFDLPASCPIARLEIGRHFDLVPLLEAIQAAAPYCVVMVEHGKARIFSVRGTEIQEIPGLFKAKDLNLGQGDSRVGWSHHIDGNEQEHARASLKRISIEIRLFMEEQKYSRLVVGCRDDLWGDLEPQLLGPDKASVIGRFHTPNFDVSPADVLKAARPIFEESLHKACKDMLHKINENPLHSAAGLNQVLESLEEGRVQTLLLGKESGEKVFECLQCGHLLVGIQDKCSFCASGNIHAAHAQEALIRKALLTEAEILLPGEAYAPDQVTAWLRY